MAINLHPRSEGFLSKLRQLTPDPLSGFFAGLCAASAGIWQEGGLMLREVARDDVINWRPGSPSGDRLLHEFFACVCGNRFGERTSNVEIVHSCLLAALQQAIPGGSIHLEVEVHEPSWCYDLHVLISVTHRPHLYLCLSWSVD